MTRYECNECIKNDETAKPCVIIIPDDVMGVKSRYKCLVAPIYLNAHFRIVEETTG